MDSTDYGEHPVLSSPSFHGRSFNKRLNPRHLDLLDDDKSCHAEVVRKVANVVSKIFRPRQVIVLLRLLKALTFCTLGLSIIADLMFIFFVEVTVSDDVNIKLGGVRDMIMRLYGVCLASLATMIELDMTVANVHFSGLKPFLPRSLLLLFVAILSASSPMIAYERRQSRQYRKYYDDDLGWGSGYNNVLIKDEVPGSAIVFQSITSFVLICSAAAYFVLGLLCLDRFTAPAFLADDDQVAAAVNATAIGDNANPRDSFDSYDAPNVRQHNYNINPRHNQAVNDGFNM
jgi:hypothetical protein